jgi:C-terminal processing protease CtpA/Prc
MKRILGLMALFVFAAVPADAGECSYSTQECLDYMATKMKDGGWVGVELDRPDEAKHGPMTVMKVVEGSPAEEAGIQPGDVLVAMNGIELSEANGEKLMQDKKNWKPGSSVNWTMKRNETDRKVAITLAPMPADILAQYIGQHMLDHAAVELAASE